MPSLENIEKERMTASSRITAMLLRRILAGSYPAGENLPPERDLAQEFGVSRHVVREALKRLDTLGLVSIQQGSGVHVNDIVLQGGIELFEYLLYDESGNIDSQILNDFFAFLAGFVPEVFRMAAVKRTEEEMRRLRALLAERERFWGNFDAIMINSLQMLQTIARATHNSIYQLVFNNLGRVVYKLRQSVPLTALEPVIPMEQLARIVEAVERGDPELAALLVLRQTEAAQQIVFGFIQNAVDITPDPLLQPVDCRL